MSWEKVKVEASATKNKVSPTLRAGRRENDA
jgi:hypothetical protein